MRKQALQLGKIGQLKEAVEVYEKAKIQGFSSYQFQHIKQYLQNVATSQSPKNFELKKNQNPEEIIHAIQASLNKHDYNMMKDSRMILRKSGTENKIRLMVEASNSQIANQMIDKANEVFIEKCKKKNFLH